MPQIFSTGSARQTAIDIECSVAECRSALDNCTQGSKQKPLSLRFRLNKSHGPVGLGTKPSGSGSGCKVPRIY